MTSRPTRRGAAPGYPGADAEPPTSPSLALVSKRATMAPIDWATFWAEDPKVEDWLVPGLLPRGRQVAIYSPAKTGKSLLALDLAAALATGRPVLGHARPPCSVLYLDLEMGPDDLRERLEDLGYGREDDLARLAYYSLPDLPPLDSSQGGEALEAHVSAHGPVSLVVVDTMARVVQGDENDSGTYRDFYKHSGLRLKRLGVALLRLDHSGKDAAKGQRGSSAKADDLDVVFRLGLVEDSVVLTRTHTRLPWVPAEVVLRRETDPLRHVTATTSQPDAARETALLLDGLGVPLDSTVSAALAALKAAGKGRRKQAVVSALRLRRGSRESGNRASGTSRRNTSGTASDGGTSAQEGEGLAVPGTNGTLVGRAVVPTCPPLRGGQGPAPFPEPEVKDFQGLETHTPSDEDAEVAAGDRPPSDEDVDRWAEEHALQRVLLAFPGSRVLSAEEAQALEVSP